MTINLNRLKEMESAELVDLAKQLNAPHHHKNSKETLIENIINKVMEQSLTHADVEQKDIAPVKPPVVFLTEQELEAALAPIKEKKPAFSTAYDHESKCVSLRYNDGRYKHAETMSLSCSLPKFVRKATEISKGPLVLRGHNQEDFGRIAVNNENSAYTQTVLG